MSLRLFRTPIRNAIFGVAFLIGTVAVSFADSAITPLVSAQWLQENLDRSDLVTIDIRGKTAEAVYGTGHVPGAVWSRYPGGWHGDGTVPGAVPAAVDLAAQIAALGVSAGDSVVIVPAGSSSTGFGGAARVYWSFKYAGHDAVAILDGGWQAWVASPDSPVEFDQVVPVKQQFAATVQSRILATTPAVSARINSDTILLDARPAAQYAGETKSAAALRAGHLPGAISLDNAMFYDPGANRIKPLPELAALIPAALADQDTEVIAY